MNNNDFAISVFPVTFAAATLDYRIDIDGSFLQYLEGDIALTVKLDAQNRAGIPLKEKDSISASFERIYITTIGAGSIKLLVCDPIPVNVGGQRVNVDKILKDDSWYANELAKCSFVANASPGAVASQYSHVMLFNPADSGKIVICKSISVTVTAIQTFNTSAYDTELANAGNEYNRYLGETGPSGRLSYETNVALLGTVLETCRTAGRVGDPFPYILKQGKGILTACTTVNYGFNLSYGWIEVPI